MRAQFKSKYLGRFWCGLVLYKHRCFLCSKASQKLPLDSPCDYDYDCGALLITHSHIRSDTNCFLCM